VQQTQNTPSYHEGWRWCPLAATERQHLNNITVTFSTKVEDTAATAAYTAPSSVSRLVDMQYRAVLADKTPTIPDFLDNARDVSSIIWSYCMHRTDAAYCYRRVTSFVVLLCVCVCACVWYLVGYTGEPYRTNESIEMLFGGQIYVGPSNRILDGGTHWRHVANTIERPVHGGNATVRQITLTTCYCY